MISYHFQTGLAMSEKIVFLTFKCKLCGRFLSRAESFYDVVLEMKSGRNQIITGESDPEKTQAEMDGLLKKIDGADPKTLEEEVYLKREFRLCLPCRTKLRDFLKI